MKILSLVVVLAYIYSCSAAANRSTMWLLADELVYSYNKNYQACTSQIGATTNTSLLTTSYYRITTGASADKAYLSTPGQATAGTPGSYFTLQSLQLIFIYGDSLTPNVVFNLPAFTAMAPSVVGGFQKLITNSIPPGTYVSATGAAWLNVQILYSATFPTSPFNYPSDSSASSTAPSASTITAATVLITDYRSRSTFAIMQYQDGIDGTGNAIYNHHYSIIVRTPSSLITTSATDILVAGCTAAATRAGTAVTAVFIAPTYSTCATSVSGSTDTSLSSSSACTDTKLPDSTNLAVAGMMALRTIDNAVFSTGSKITVTTNFGVFIAMSSVILSILH